MNVNTGVNLTTLGMLNLCENKENIRSTISCVKKFKTISEPKKVYDSP